MTDLGTRPSCMTEDEFFTYNYLKEAFLARRQACSSEAWWDERVRAFTELTNKLHLALVNREDYDG